MSGCTSAHLASQTGTHSRPTSMDLLPLVFRDRRRLRKGQSMIADILALIVHPTRESTNRVQLDLTCYQKHYFDVQVATSEKKINCPIKHDGHWTVSILILMNSLQLRNWQAQSDSGQLAIKQLNIFANTSLLYKISLLCPRLSQTIYDHTFPVCWP